MGTPKALNPDLLKGTEGTLLHEVLSTTNEETAAFLQEVGNAPTDTDKKVTDILPLEAALFLHAKTNGVAAEKLIDDFNTEVEAKKQENGKEIPEGEREAFFEKRKQVKAAARKLKKKAELFAEVAWGSIRSRIEDIESLEIRNGGAIIDVTAAEGEKCPNCGKVHGKGGLVELLELVLS
ncbi:MAG: hypothetical protein WCG20_01310 [bacterium]